MQSSGTMKKLASLVLELNIKTAHEEGQICIRDFMSPKSSGQSFCVYKNPHGYGEKH